MKFNLRNIKELSVNDQTNLLAGTGFSSNCSCSCSCTCSCGDSKPSAELSSSDKSITESMKYTKNDSIK